MKSTAWLRVVVVLLLLLGLAAALLRWAVPLPDDDWRKSLALNLVTEMAGAALTYVLFELFIGLMKERQAKLEAEKKEREAKKADLIAKMGSSERSAAIPAVEELRRHGWLTDGSLRGAKLMGANLQGASLFGADLQGAILTVANLQGAYLLDANLQGAILGGANLQGAFLVRANLQGANLYRANLQAAALQQANFDPYTTLPDGTKWTLGTDMARFTDPGHPDFWQPPEE